MTRIRILAIAAILLAATACTSTRNYWSGASVRDVSTLAFYGVQHKELVFVQVPCGGKPYLVSMWARGLDISNMVVLCDANCNCKLAKKTPKMKIIPAKSESGICQ